MPQTVLGVCWSELVVKVNPSNKLSCAPECGRSRRTNTRILVGQAVSWSPFRSVAQQPGQLGHVGFSTQQREHYTGAAQRLQPITDMPRVAIRIDLKHYASWSKPRQLKAKKSSQRDQRRRRQQVTPSYRSIEEYLAHQIATHSGGQQFDIRDLATVLSTRPTLLALDSLDEVANLDDRGRVANAIADTAARLSETAGDLVILVASRPGATGGRLWSPIAFPKFTLQRLTTGLRVQYLQGWATQADLAVDRAEHLQRDPAQARGSAAHPRAGLQPHAAGDSPAPSPPAAVPAGATNRALRQLHLDVFDREDDKEPLVQTERAIVEDIHAYLAWHLQCQTELGRAAGSIRRTETQTLLDDCLRDHEMGRQLADRLFKAFTTRMICLVVSDADDVEFEVQSLREYFAARFIKEHAPIRGDAGNTRDDCINALLERPYWSNVLRFLVGMLSLGEIRGIPSNLRALLQKGTSGLPHGRWMAAQLLDDRIFGALGDGPVQDIVDVALDGPGVTLGRTASSTRPGHRSPCRTVLDVPRLSATFKVGSAAKATPCSEHSSHAD